MKSGIVVTIFLTIVSGEDSIVSTKSGQLRGKRTTLFNGKNVIQYLGVPFATPPVGELRFKHPLPVQPWDGVINATKKAPACMQKSYPGEKLVPLLALLSSGNKIQEDCLYLNVYVPETRGTKLPVIVYIFGGAFSVGSPSATLYDGSTLASQENVIVVVFAYRVATFGFLYLDHPDMDANVGLMDQVMALKWIHSNIANFGGDTNSITLMGQSSGASSIGFHLISNISRHYFNRAMMQSGSPLSEWTIQTKEENLAFGKKLIDFYGCPKMDNLTAVVRCLKDADPFELMSNEPTRDYDTAIFRPVVDGFFITEDPNQSMKKGDFKKTSILTGVTKNEASPFLIGLMPLVFSFLADRVNPLYEDFVTLVSETLRYAAPATLQAIIYEYTPWKNKTDPNKILRSCDHMFTDYYFNCGNNDMARYYAEAGQRVYKYYYAHSSNALKTPKWMGAFHGHDVGYILGYLQNPKHKFASTEKMFSKRLMRYWANFARTGDPNISPNGEEGIEWPEYTLENKEALVLAPNTTAVMTNHRTRQCALWSQYIPYIENLVKEGKLDKRVSKWY